MGRFATTAPLYEQFRPLYPPGYFRTVAQKLGLSKQHALLISAPDQGFSHSALRLMSAIVGVDPEPAMLEAARKLHAE